MVSSEHGLLTLSRCAVLGPCDDLHQPRRHPQSVQQHRLAKGCAVMLLALAMIVLRLRRTRRHLLHDYAFRLLMATGVADQTRHMVLPRLREEPQARIASDSCPQAAGTQAAHGQPLARSQR